MLQKLCAAEGTEIKRWGKGKRACRRMHDLFPTEQNKQYDGSADEGC